jgi:hypothetical protein
VVAIGKGGWSLWPLLRAMQDENDVDSITTDGEIVSQGLS